MLVDDSPPALKASLNDIHCRYRTTNNALKYKRSIQHTMLVILSSWSRLLLPRQFRKLRPASARCISLMRLADGRCHNDAPGTAALRVVLLHYPHANSVESTRLQSSFLEFGALACTLNEQQSHAVYSRASCLLELMLSSVRRRVFLISWILDLEILSSFLFSKHSITQQHLSTQYHINNQQPILPRTSTTCRSSNSLPLAVWQASPPHASAESCRLATRKPAVCTCSHNFSP